jgi:two-component system phosphate regulon response regulator PhoB
MIALGPAGEGDDAVNALRLGADDYVRRPLHIAEFLARIEALVRRSEMAGQSYIADDGVYLERRSRQLVLEGRSVDLTPTEFKVLEVLIERKGQTISREELVKRVWGKDAALGNTNLSLYIWHLRPKSREQPRSSSFYCHALGSRYMPFRTGDVRFFLTVRVSSG